MFSHSETKVMGLWEEYYRGDGPFECILSGHTSVMCVIANGDGNLDLCVKGVSVRHLPL